MAELAFKVKADYDEAIRLRDELSRLRTEMSKVDASTEEGKKQMALLSKEFANTSASLDVLVKKAAELAYFMGSEFKGKVQEAGNEVERLSSALKDANDNLANVKQNGEEYSGQMDELKERVSSLTNALEPAQKNYTELKDKMDQYNGAAEENSGIMVKLLGGQEKYNATMSMLPSKLKNVVTGINKTTKAAWEFIKTPVGATIAALVLALQALKKWFNSSAEGQRKFAEITGYVKGMIDQLGEVVVRVGKAVYDAFSNLGETAKNAWNTIKQNFVNHFIGFANILPSFGKMVKDVFELNWDALNDDFKGFRNNVEMMITGVDNLEDKWKNAANAVGDFVQKVGDAGKEQSAINRERFDLDKQYSDWEVKKSEQNAKKNELRTAMYDTNASPSQRKKALDEYKQILTEQQKMELQFADKRIELQEREMALTTNPIEAEKALNDLRVQKNQIVASTNAELAMLQRRENGIVNSGKSDADNSIKQRMEWEETLRKQEKEELERMREMEFNVTQARIDAMEEGGKKTRAQMELDHRKELAALEKEFNELRDQKIQREKELYEANPNNYDGQHRLKSPFTYDYNDSRYNPTQEEKDAYSLRVNLSEARYNAQIVKENRDAMNKYLQEYGTYEERKLAITEEYERKISKVAIDNEGDRLLLQRQRDKALRELEQDFQDRYWLIFANANNLSNDLLSQAITATNEAIKEAKESGDIQALTELYKRLREQMSVQGDRNRGWGFAGIVQGFALRNASDEKRELADELTKNLAKREVWLEQMKALGTDEGKTEAARKKIEELREEIRRLREDSTQDGEKALDSLERGFNEVTSVFSQLGSIMSSFGNGKGGALDTIAEIGEGLSGLASHADDVKKMFELSESGSMDKSSAWATAISGTIELISMVGTAIQNNKKAQEEWNRTIEESDHQFKMLQLDALDYEQSNIFGVEDPFKKATDSAEQYRKSMEGLSEVTAKLAGGQVQTGTKKVVNWSNVGKGLGIGAAVGAAVGTIVGPVGTAIGAAVGMAIGAVTGAVAGLLSTKVVPVFESLADHYGQLFDPDTYELNERLLADYDKLDEDTKQIVDHWDEIKKKAEEARQELRDNLSDFAGDLGKKLEDTLVEAWKSRRLYSAVDDYKKYVGQQIASILEQRAFSAIFESLFTDLGKKMEDSFLGPNADNDIVDDMDEFNRVFPQYLDAYGQMMDQMNEQLESMGYGGLRGRQDNANTTSGSYQNISETTGSAIQGGVTSLRISSEVRNQHLSLMSANLTEMLHQQLRSCTLAEDIRGIQVDSYLALVSIRDSASAGLSELRGIRGLAERIEKQTREL